EFPPGYSCRFVVVVSRHAFARRLAPAAETTPVRGLGYYTFVGTDRRVRDARARGSTRRTAFGHCARRLDHETAERHHGDVGSADTLLAAVADRPHAFPPRDILIGNARNAGEVAGLHGGAILQVVVFARADAIEIRVDVDAPLQHVEL